MTRLECQKSTDGAVGFQDTESLAVTSLAATRPAVTSSAAQSDPYIPGVPMKLPVGPTRRSDSVTERETQGSFRGIRRPFAAPQPAGDSLRHPGLRPLGRVLSAPSSAAVRGVDALTLRRPEPADVFTPWSTTYYPGLNSARVASLMKGDSHESLAIRASTLINKTLG